MTLSMRDLNCSSNVSVCGLSGMVLYCPSGVYRPKRVLRSVARIFFSFSTSFTSKRRRPELSLMVGRMFSRLSWVSRLTLMSKMRAASRGESICIGRV